MSHTPLLLALRTKTVAVCGAKTQPLVRSPGAPACWGLPIKGRHGL